MGIEESFDFESIIFNYIDELKFLFFPEQWNTTFLDYSKNDLLTLLFLYRNKKANMSEIAGYINAPLNTATGIISRLEKKLMVERIRSDEDRRIVYIILTKKAEEFIDNEKKLAEHYFKEIYKTLTDDEKLAAIGIFKKIVSVLKHGNDNISNDEKTIKKVRRITIE